MGAKYNNKNLRHRTWLAQNILSILPKWGFEIDEEYEENCWEFVLSKWDKFDLTRKIIVYTSIDKMSGAIRPVGTDAIRVVAIRIQNNDENIGLYRRKVNRTGEFKAITDRMIMCIKAAQRI